MNKIAIVSAFLTLFFLFVGLSNAKVIVSAPDKIIMIPNSTYILRLTILNQDEIERAYLVNLASDLTLEPKQKTIILNAQTSEPFIVTVKSGREIGYYPILLGIENENYSKQITVRVSQVPNQIKSLIEYYESRLLILKTSLNESSDEIKVLIFGLETKLDDSKKSYADENYDSAYDSLESVRNSLEKIEKLILNTGNATEFEAKEKNLSLIAKKNKEFWFKFLEPGSYSIGTALVILLFYLLFGRKKFILRKRKLSIEHLKHVRSHLKNKKADKSEETAPELKEQINNLELSLKNLSQKKGLRELELELALVKEKYKKGMYKMCQEYLTSLKKKVRTAK